MNSHKRKICIETRHLLAAAAASDRPFAKIQYRAGNACTEVALWGVLFTNFAVDNQQVLDIMSVCLWPE